MIAGEEMIAESIVRMMGRPQEIRGCEIIGVIAVQRGSPLTISTQRIVGAIAVIRQGFKMIAGNCKQSIRRTAE